MKHRKYSPLLIIFLLIASQIFGLFKLTSEDTYAADYSDLVRISQYSVEGQLSGTTEVDMEESINISIDFNIPSLPAGAAAGDTFSIKVPSVYHFSYLKPTGMLPPNSDDPLVTYEIVGDEIIFTLCDAAIDANSLTNGHLDLVAKAVRDGDNISSGGDNSVGPITVNPAPDPNPGVNEDVPFKYENKFLFKNGNQLNGENAINWTMHLNYLEYGNLFDLYNQDKGISKVKEKSNGMIVDHLAPGTHFRENSLYVTVPTYIVTTTESNFQMGSRQIGEGKISGKDQVYDFRDILIERTSHGEGDDPTAFIKITPNSGESYDNFAARVQAYPDANNGQRAYGIFKHADDTESVLIAFGTLPGSVHYYDDLRRNFTIDGVTQSIGIQEAINAEETITDEQKQILRDIYGKSDKSPSNGAITAYDIGFDVDVDTPEFGSGKYENGIDFVYDEGKESTQAETNFVEQGGDLDADFLKANKEVEGDEGTPLAEPKTFKFNIVDGAGRVKAYGKTKSDINNKGEEIEIEFFWDQQYTRKIENTDESSPDYWSNVLTEDQWYYIQEVDADGYEVHIQDTTGNDTNKFKYSSKIAHRWRFAVINKEPIKIEVKKQIVGLGNLGEDKVFEFQLQDARTDLPVAYGKTTITTSDGKNTEKSVTFYQDAEYKNEITDWKKMTIDNQEVVILEDGVTYRLVEVDSQGYEVTYYNNKDALGNLVEGNTYTANYAVGGKFTFYVNNKDTFTFNANKEISGTGVINPEKTFAFELQDIADSNKTIAYGRVTVNQRGQSQAIEFFTSNDYAAVNKISDWAALLAENKTYRLIETNTQHFDPIYSGGSGEKNNEFTVTYNNAQKNITLQILNKDTFDFTATKKVTGDGHFSAEDFNFELRNSQQTIVAYGKAQVDEKNKEVPITFYTDPDDEASKITDWTNILVEGETYHLKEVGDSGYAVTYKNQAGTTTDKFTASFNTGNSLSIHVDNYREKIPLPKTGGSGIKQYLVYASSIIVLTILAVGIVEYRRKVGD